MTATATVKHYAQKKRSRLSSTMPLFTIPLQKHTTIALQATPRPLNLYRRKPFSHDSLRLIQSTPRPPSPPKHQRSMAASASTTKPFRHYHQSSTPHHCYLRTPHSYDTHRIFSVPPDPTTAQQLMHTLASSTTVSRLSGHYRRNATQHHLSYRRNHVHHNKHWPLSSLPAPRTTRHHKCYRAAPKTSPNHPQVVQPFLVYTFMVPARRPVSSASSLLPTRHLATRSTGTLPCSHRAMTSRALPAACVEPKHTSAATLSCGTGFRRPLQRTP